MNAQLEREGRVARIRQSCRVDVGREMLVLLCVASCGGARGYPMAEAGVGGPQDAAISDSVVAADTADGNPAALDIPGLAVWLDGDSGITASASGMSSWRERSRQGHVFLGQTPSDVWPTPTDLRGHGAIHFDGTNRMISEQAPSPAQMDSLTLGDGGFLLAMVFQADAVPVDTTVLAAIAGPWSGVGAAGVPAVNGGAPLFLFLESRGLGAMVASQNVPASGAGVDFTVPHLLEIAVERDRISLRIDRHELASVACEAACKSAFEYAPLFAGNWDFDLHGLTGILGELVLVKGTPSPAVVSSIESYLMGKYRL